MSKALIQSEIPTKYKIIVTLDIFTEIYNFKGLCNINELSLYL